MATEQANITEAVVKVAVETARVVIQAMTMAKRDNNQMAQNMGPN